MLDNHNTFFKGKIELKLEFNFDKTIPQINFNKKQSNNTSRLID